MDSTVSVVSSFLALFSGTSVASSDSTFLLTVSSEKKNVIKTYKFMITHYRNIPVSGTGSTTSAVPLPFSDISAASPPTDDSTVWASASSSDVVVVGAATSSTTAVASLSSPEATTGESSTSSTTFSVTLLSTTGVSLQKTN